MTNKKIIILIMLIVFVAGIVWVVTAKKSNTLDEKVLLFKKYIETKDDLNALQAFRQIEKNANKLDTEQTLYVASNAAAIARNNGDYELERDIYRRFFKAELPFYYYLFTAGSFGAQNNLVKQREELLQAKKIAKDEAQESAVDHLLAINEKKVELSKKQ